MSNLLRFIKDSRGEKTLNRTRSVNITQDQHEFLNRKDMNLSLIIRQVLDGLMTEERGSVSAFADSFLKNKLGRKLR